MCTMEKFYLSPKIQNELVQYMSDQVRHELLKLIKQAKYFVLIVDESRDASRTEQVSISLRFVNSDCQVEECFLCFEETSSTKSENLYRIITSNLEKWGLSLDNCRVQSYDGASNMAGETSGVQERVLQRNPLALFVHCCAHNLNLALVDCCTECTEVVSFFGILQTIYTFFTPSLVRLDIAEKKCEELNLGKISFKRLQVTR